MIPETEVLLFPVLFKTALPPSQKRPVRHPAGQQAPPDDDRLQRQPGHVIPGPERGCVGAGEVVDGVFDVGGVDADGVGSEGNPGGGAPSPGQQACGAGELAEAGDDDDVAWIGHPAGRDRHEDVGPGEVEDAGDGVENGEKAPRPPARC